MLYAYRACYIVLLVNLNSSEPLLLRSKPDQVRPPVMLQEMVRCHVYDTRTDTHTHVKVEQYSEALKFNFKINI